MTIPSLGAKTTINENNTQHPTRDQFLVGEINTTANQLFREMAGAGCGQPPVFAEHPILKAIEAQSNE